MANKVQPNPAPQPVPAFNPEVAANRLSKSNVSNLWDEKVSRADHIFKIVGVFQFVLGYFTARSNDKEFGETIAEYNSKLCALVTATANRNLTPAEEKIVGISALQMNNPNNQIELADRHLAAANAEKAFYEVFKKRCTQLKVDFNSNDFAIYTKGAVNTLEKHAAFETKNQNALQAKLQTAIKGFNSKVFNDMVNTFASQPALSITPNGFNDKAKAIKGFFPDNSIVDIEAALRQALKGTYDQDFKKLSDEFLLPGAANKKVEEIEKDLKAKLTAEQKDLDTQDKAFRGTTGFNGTVDVEFQKTVAPKADLETAIAKFKTEYSKHYNGVNAESDYEKLMAIVGANESKDLTDARADLKVKFDAFSPLHKAYVEIDTKAKEVAKKLAEVNSKLDPVNLGNLALDEAKKIGKFYGELNITVGPSQNSKQTRYNAMHALDILGK